MTISRGTDWGEPARLPPGAPTAATDRELRALVDASLRRGGPAPHIGLIGGDLCRTVGGTGATDRLHIGSGVSLPVDVGEVLLDGTLHRFVAHLVARRSWWRGRIVVIANAQWLGPWDVAPRAHPNDGRLDMLDVSASMRVRDRVQARARLPQGTHVPHPAIEYRQTAAVQFSFDPGLDVWLDGERVGRYRHLSARCEPDAFTVVV